MNHTEGKWGASSQYENDSIKQELDAALECIAIDIPQHEKAIWVWGTGGKEHQANAKLIAASSDMIEALNWAKGFGKNGNSHDKIIMDKIESAIKKATT